MTRPTPYVLITPARDEAEHIGRTIESMVSQTVRPLKWVIVSDGSTDGTDQVVQKYAAEHPWIELVMMPPRRERHFAGKVNAFNAGYARVQGLEYEVIGSLDGDTSFDPDHFSFLLDKLDQDLGLGLVGTPFSDDGTESHYDYRYVSVEHVSGICQLFRRECFEAIGGYTPVPLGGIDFLAVIGSRMKGWKTRTFTEKVMRHHRKMGSAEHGMLRVGFKVGVKDYTFGNHPVWELFRTAYQMTKRPYVIGGLTILCGYMWSLLRRRQRPVSPELVTFCRAEQMERLKRFLGLRRRTGSETLKGRPERV